MHGIPLDLVRPDGDDTGKDSGDDPATIDRCSLHPFLRGCD